MLRARSKAPGCTNVPHILLDPLDRDVFRGCSLFGLVEKERRPVYTGDAKAAPGKGNGKASRPAAEVEDRLRPPANEPRSGSISSSAAAIRAGENI